MQMTRGELYYIGNVNVRNTLIILGSIINHTHLSVIQRIIDLDMNQTKMALQPVDKSIKRPSRIAEDILFKVDRFLFLVDFVVMDIEEDNRVPLILGRLLRKITRVLINIDDGNTKVRVQDKEVSFNIFK